MRSSTTREAEIAQNAGFRTAMARLGASVNIITSDGPAGRYGLAASAVCSVSDTPPTLLVCINRSSAGNAIVKANGVLCVNILAGRHEDLARRFSTSGVTIEQRFAETALWTTLSTGSPVLTDASVSLDCRVTSVTEIGSHSVIFAEVEDVVLHEQAECLVYFDRRFMPLV